MQTSNSVEYEVLSRALLWNERFGVYYVGSSPVQGRELATQLTSQLEKRCQTVELDAEIEGLYQYILSLPNYQSIQVLFIFGLDKSFEPYFSQFAKASSKTYLTIDCISPFLTRLNMDRERLHKEFPQLSVVFMLQEQYKQYINYIQWLAPDFFDWYSSRHCFTKECNM